MQIITNDLMSISIGISQPAGNLLSFRNRTHKRKITYLFIAILSFHSAVIQAAGIDSRRRTRLKRISSTPCSNKEDDSLLAERNPLGPDS